MFYKNSIAKFIHRPNNKYLHPYDIFSESTHQLIVMFDSLKSQRGPIINFLIRKGIARSIPQANYVLVFFTVLNCTIMFLTYHHFFIQPRNAPKPFLEDIPAEIRATLPAEVLNQLPSRFSHDEN